MKKLLAIVFIIIIIVTALCGCSNNISSNATNSTSSSTITTSFPQENLSEAGVEQYKEEITFRLEENKDTFVTDEEWEVIQKFWFTEETPVRTKNGLKVTKYSETYECLFPVLYQDSDRYILWYAGSNGSVYHKTLESDIIGVNYYQWHIDIDANT